MKKISLLTVIMLIIITCFSSVYAAAPVQNRFYSVYSSSFNSDMMYRMNCYGYATRLYYKGSVSSFSPYKQQPGEFAQNSEPFSDLQTSYAYAATVWNNFGPFVKDRVFEDFSTLGWSIQQTTSTSQASSGTRKIALAIRQDGINSDYHFYMQHSNGTWSHKRGSSDITNLSIDSETTITNSNIATKAMENGYDDGFYIFIITKDAVLDYPHNYGHYDSTTYTTTNFYDKSGDTITSCTSISGDKYCRFDHSYDKDYFMFTPTMSKSYTISTSCGSGYDVDADIYDYNGDIIASDRSYSNANLTVYMLANKTYYIGIWDYNDNIDNYWLYID